MWSAALRWVGGSGRALVVDVLKVEAAGEEGWGEIGEDMGAILAVPGGEVGFWRVWMGSGVRSAWGTGRRRPRIEDAADAAVMGSVTTLGRSGVVMGKGWGGDGGGECWYVVALL
tara:strand:+ start:13354 stop:13698 length:345 start_codon:yes stop_codon:yes gene_type:complete